MAAIIEGCRSLSPHRCGCLNVTVSSPVNQNVLKTTATAAKNKREKYRQPQLLLRTRGRSAAG
ncbi:hypothetical protein TIFTF001_016205 [Ficus carica]|uniref:Uncharacterized protein n=1 Tax=Ficus carica TaxID=3494 RepID=A0AA88A5W0_FICCA|nr:hypothetical protein TIFTF001_016205 [Ficus carica]